jgi:hypothetical protein
MRELPDWLLVVGDMRQVTCFLRASLAAVPGEKSKPSAYASPQGTSCLDLES